MRSRDSSSCLFFSAGASILAPHGRIHNSSVYNLQGGGNTASNISSLGSRICGERYPARSLPPQIHMARNSRFQRHRAAANKFQKECVSCQIWGIVISRDDCTGTAAIRLARYLRSIQFFVTVRRTITRASNSRLRSISAVACHCQKIFSFPCTSNKSVISFGTLRQAAQASDCSMSHPSAASC